MRHRQEPEQKHQERARRTGMRKTAQNAISACEPAQPHPSPLFRKFDGFHSKQKMRLRTFGCWRQNSPFRGASPPISKTDSHGNVEIAHDYITIAFPWGKNTAAHAGDCRHLQRRGCPTSLKSGPSGKCPPFGELGYGKVNATPGKILLMPNSLASDCDRLRRFTQQGEKQFSPLSPSSGFDIIANNALASAVL